MNHFPVKAVVFDLGGVLFDWDAEYVYRELIPDEAARRDFLGRICNGAWRLKQDAGQTLEQGTEELIAAYPEHRESILAFYARWHEMLKGTLPEGMEIFERLRELDVPLYALTNWAAQTWPYATDNYPFLQHFRRVIVSGQEGMVKPDPMLYRLMHERITLDLPGIAPCEVAFIDDVLTNAAAATQFGWQGIHHTDAAQTAERLRQLGIPL